MPAMSRVLIVDDDPSIRTTVAMLLRMEGHEVSVAADGAAGLAAARAAPPEVILSDLHMPGLTGLQLMQAVRAEPLLAATRVVLLTGVTGEPIAAADGSAPDAVLTKPFAREQLLATLAAFKP